MLLWNYAIGNYFNVFYYLVKVLARPSWELKEY